MGGLGHELHFSWSLDRFRVWKTFLPVIWLLDPDGVFRRNVQGQ